MDFAGKDKDKYVKETFNHIAEKYDVMNSLMSFGMDKRWRRKVVQVVKAEPGMKMLDVCCGTGMLTRELSRQVTSTGQVIGLDFSEKMLDKAWRNINSIPTKENIKLLQGDALKLPFENNFFNGATIGWGLRNLHSSRLGIQEMVRVVQPGSMVVSIDMGKPSLPIFKEGYWLYFERIVPLIGKIWAGKQKEYDYLYQSAKAFESQTELVNIFKDCGLLNTGHIDLVGGAVAIVYGQKP